MSREPIRIKGTYKLSKHEVEAGEIRILILRRRLQILVHSCIYYRLNESIVTDSLWTKWAQELVELQKEYPSIASRVDYHGEFKNFDGNTGYDLPIYNPEILAKAYQLLELSKK